MDLKLYQTSHRMDKGTPLRLQKTQSKGSSMYCCPGNFTKESNRLANLNESTDTGHQGEVLRSQKLVSKGSPLSPNQSFF